MVWLIQIFAAIVFFLVLYKLWKWWNKKMVSEDVTSTIDTVKAEERAAEKIPNDLKKRSAASKKKLNDLRDV